MQSLLRTYVCILTSSISMHVRKYDIVENIALANRLAQIWAFFNFMEI